MVKEEGEIMNSAKAIVGTAILTTAGIIAGGIATGGFNTPPQNLFPTQKNEFILQNEMEADQFVKQHFPKELKKLKR